MRKPVNPWPESATRDSRPRSTGDRGGSRSARAASPRHVAGDSGSLDRVARGRGSRLPPLGASPDELRSVRGLHRRCRTPARRERVRLAHGASTASALERHAGRVPPVDVHGTGPSQGRTCDPNRRGGDEVGESPRDSRDPPSRLAVRRGAVCPTRFRAHDGDAKIPPRRTAKPRSFPKKTVHRLKGRFAPGEHASLHIRP